MDDVNKLEKLRRSVIVIGGSFEIMAQVSKAFADMDVIVVEPDSKVLEDEFNEARKLGELAAIEAPPIVCLNEKMLPYELKSKAGARNPNEFYFKGKHVTNKKWQQRKLKNHMRKTSPRH